LQSDSLFLPRKGYLTNALATYACERVGARARSRCYHFADGRLEYFGNQIGYGNLTGYNPHFAWFGALTGATPDGRKAGVRKMCFRLPKSMP